MTSPLGDLSFLPLHLCPVSNPLLSSLPSHALPCYAIPSHTISCYAISSLLCHPMLCHPMLCHPIPLMLYHACYAIPCHPMPSHAIPCHPMPSHAIPCHPMPSHAIPYACYCHTVLVLLIYHAYPDELMFPLITIQPTPSFHTQATPIYHALSQTSICSQFISTTFHFSFSFLFNYLFIYLLSFN